MIGVIIPITDAQVAYRGEWGLLEITDGFDPSISSIWEPGNRITITVTDPDFNKDPNSIEKITFPSSNDFVLVNFDGGDPNIIMNKKQSSIPHVGHKPGIFHLPSSERLILGLENFDCDNYFSSRWFSDVSNQCTDPNNNPYVYPDGTKNLVALVRDDNFGFLGTHYTPDSVTTLSDGDFIIIPNMPGLDTYLHSSNNDFRIGSNPNAFHFADYDLRSLNEKLSSGKINSIKIEAIGTNWSYSPSLLLVGPTSSLEGFIPINLTAEEVQAASLDAYTLKITFLDVEPSTQFSPNQIIPLHFDIATFGYRNDGHYKTDYLLDYSFRLEVEETGADTGVFTGTVEYKLITGKNVADVTNYSNLDPSSKNLIIPSLIHENNGLRLSYYELGRDGVVSQMADQINEYFYPAPIPDITFTTDEDTPITITDIDWGVYVKVDNNDQDETNIGEKEIIGDH